MLRIAIKAALLTVIIEASALVFADEMFITLLVLFTIAITATWLVLGDRETSEISSSRNALRFATPADSVSVAHQASESVR